VLGDPQESIPSVHVTGTNGKGSTSAMVTALLIAQGLSVGTYTSPNLHGLRAAGPQPEPIDDESFLEVLAELASLEVLVAIARRDSNVDGGGPLVVRGRGVDAMVVEVGLGGTWTAPTWCTETGRPDQLQLDHTDVLGRRWRALPRTSRIIEPEVTRGGGGSGGPGVHCGGPCVERRGGVGLGGRPGLRLRVQRRGRGWPLVTLTTPGGRYPDVLVPLHGAHQGQKPPAPGRVEAFFARSTRCVRPPSRRCGCPDGSRCWDATPSCWLTARTSAGMAALGPR